MRVGVSKYRGVEVGFKRSRNLPLTSTLRHSPSTSLGAVSLSNRDTPTLLNIDPKVTTEILTAFLVNEAGKFGFTKAVVGVSGGLDSATVAILAARAYGPNNVLGVLLPYKHSSPDSLKDGLALVRQTKIRHEVVDITPLAEPYIERFKAIDRVRIGNVLARLRMLVLFDLSHRGASLVMGTSNKTELLLGYSTWYGDMASSLNPIGDLYKSQVRQLAAFLKVSKPIQKKIPTADLWVGQSDEGELGFTYDEVDRLLYYLIDELATREQLVSLGFRESLVKRVERMIYNSQFKRSLPIICKLSRRTVGIDFQLSKDWGR